eukprot:gene35454-43716_t
MAFVNLYPFGKGGPELDSHIKMSPTYVTYLLNLGRSRLFQQSPSFIFYAYSWKMKRKSGQVAWLATRNGSNEVHPDDRVTVQECQEFLEACKAARSQSKKADGRRGHQKTTESLLTLITETKMRKFINRLQPFAEEFTGTELFWNSKRKQLLAMICSPATTARGVWMWFYTECQPDMYMAEIYDNAITSASLSTPTLALPWHATLEERRTNSDLLTKAQRAKILRDHPFMSARLHAEHQTIFWDCILNGKHKPLGTITDSWRRVEFQERGTPHSHNMIAVVKNVDETGVALQDAISEQSLQNLENGPEVEKVIWLDYQLMSLSMTTIVNKKSSSDTVLIARPTLWMESTLVGSVSLLKGETFATIKTLVRLKIPKCSHNTANCS